MPAILDDPAAPTVFRVSGDAPFPDPAHPAVPPTILPRHVTLRDRQTVATVVPFASRHEVPESLLRYLHVQFNKEIDGGDTYPMLEPMPFDKFASYWFQNFGGIMLLGHIEGAADVVEDKDWSKDCLGTFYIKPNYPGRSSHICNAGFIVTDAARNRGVGRLMGETYLDWAPKLGYKYSVFNLVYETNVASCKIWDALGFKRIGRVKGAGNLKSYPDRLVDAIIYGRDLGDPAGGPGSEELVSEERFDKIKFYLKYGRYPNGADRAEKSRLRSAATHYKLLDGDVLMLKDKEVISDPQRQYEIARAVHNQAHGGINKTTSTIAERYHWSRIKETVSDVIKNCVECKDAGKASSSQSQQPSPGAAPANSGLKRPILSSAPAPASKRASPSPSAAGSAMDLTTASPLAADSSLLSPFGVTIHPPFPGTSAISTAHHTLPSPTDTTMTGHEVLTQDTHDPMLQDAPQGTLHPHHQHHHHASPAHAQMTLSTLGPDSDYQPIDPQIISQPSVAAHHQHHLHHAHHHHHQPHHYAFSHPSPPPHPAAPHHDHDATSSATAHHDPDVDAADVATFQALINAAATDDGEDEDGGIEAGNGGGALRGGGVETVEGLVLGATATAPITAIPKLPKHHSSEKHSHPHHGHDRDIGDEQQRNLDEARTDPARTTTTTTASMGDGHGTQGQTQIHGERGTDRNNEGATTRTLPTSEQEEDENEDIITAAAAAAAREQCLDLDMLINSPSHAAVEEGEQQAERGGVDEVGEVYRRDQGQERHHVEEKEREGLSVEGTGANHSSAMDIDTDEGGGR